MKTIKIIKENENDQNIHVFSNQKIKKIIYLFFFLTFYTMILIYFLSNKTIKNDSQKFKKFSDIELLKLLTYNNPSIYNGIERCLRNNSDDEMCFYQYICPKVVKGKKRVLIGDKKDGSYIMLDDFDNIKIAYSFGIYKLIQFDKALADKGIDVYMYDHTINNLPYENSRFHWKKIGIGGNSQRSNNIKTLEEMIKENGHTTEKNMILKIDVEYAEWDSLNEVSENILKQFKYTLLSIII